MFSVLVYPNITFRRDLEADSYVVVLGAIIRHLKRDDIEWTVLLPERVASLDLPNVRQVVYPLPSYPNQMRCHFETGTFLRAIDWRNRSYDAVWCHLPEHALQIRNCLANLTNERPVMVGYAHWFELPENTGYAENLLPVNLHGCLAMDMVGVNSAWLRRIVLKHAQSILAPSLWKELSERLVVQAIGCDEPWAGAVAPEPGMILFNHRANEYTGFNTAVKVFDEMWRRRQDFEVVFTLADVDRPWARRMVEPDRDRYLAQIGRAWVGVAPFRRYSAWSVSVIDGMSQGIPYVVPNKLCYPEMVGADYPLLYDDTAGMIRHIESVLDDPALRNAAATAASHAADRWSWPTVVRAYDRMFDAAFARIDAAKVTSASYARAHKYASVGMTKYELIKAIGWEGGSRIPWTPYRQALRENGFAVTSDAVWPAHHPERRPASALTLPV